MDAEHPEITLKELRSSNPSAYKIVERLMYKAMKVFGRTNSSMGSEEILEGMEKLFDAGLFKMAAVFYKGYTEFYLLVYVNDRYDYTFDDEMKKISVTVTNEEIDKWEEEE